MIKSLNNVQFEMIQDTKNSILKNLQAMKYMGFEYLDPINLDITSTQQINLPENLNDLNNIVNNCNLCTLSKIRKNVLFGTGNVNSKVMFIGTSPSLIEDESASLLLGNSGDMLVKMCQNVLALNIDDIYVTNILKCFSNKEQSDNDLEVNTCKPYIQKQIDIISPEIIVLFGDAYEYLIKDTKSFKEVRGMIQNYNGIKVMPTFSPSFILRNPSFKKDVLEDLKKVKVLIG